MTTKFGKFVITCSEPGCYNRIPYDHEDYEVPLYCSYHRTTAGRHSNVRVLKKPESQTPTTPETVSFICRICKTRKSISKEDWLAGKLPDICCGREMVYHGEDKRVIGILEK